MTDDIGEMVESDVEKFKRLRSRGGWGLPGYLELGFGAVTGVVLVGWLLALLWVPDPIDGNAWMGVGMLALLLTGVPTAAIFWLRRGGADIVRAVVRGLVG